MPVVSRFYGIIIFMNYNDHNPPHFHARYQDYEIIVEIQSGLVQGKMPKRALQFIFEWMNAHETISLRANSYVTRERIDFETITRHGDKRSSL